MPRSRSRYFHSGLPPIRLSFSRTTKFQIRQIWQTLSLIMHITLCLDCQQNCHRLEKPGGWHFCLTSRVEKNITTAYINTKIRSGNYTQYSEAHLHQFILEGEALLRFKLKGAVIDPTIFAGVAYNSIIEEELKILSLTSSMTGRSPLRPFLTE